MTTKHRVVEAANRAGSKLAAWSPVERLLAVTCVVSPLVMSWIDPQPLRESISAYYSMTDNQWFYVPLSVAAMLFAVNGVTKHKHWYNWVLGAALAGVLMFNTNDWTIAHMIFAIAFFGGNVAVMIWWSEAPATYRYSFAAVIVVGLFLLAIGVISVWVAEFVSLLAIGAHYLLDSLEGDRWDWYSALPRGANPWSRSAPSVESLSG